METSEMEKKWRSRWENARIFEPEIKNKKKKKFITAAFPYPNSPQHIGHGRVYSTTDIYARYCRMQGYNVLFPMGFHVTGTPILAMAQRIAKGDAELLQVFTDIYGIPENVARSLSTPEELVVYFSKEIEEGMKEMGYSIDWRRKFYSFDKTFNRFIEWQFKKLKEHGYLVQGDHPVAWCPKDNNAIGAHDTHGDVDPELKEFTLIKFAYEDGYLLAATLRPETIYGVTNIWINPQLQHVKAKSKKTGEIYYIAKKAYEKINFQGFEAEIVEEFNGEKLVNSVNNISHISNINDNNNVKGKKAKNLVTGEEIPIYPAVYVRDDTGTGIVMSVPSHAPYDYIALRDMGITMEYEPIIEVEGYRFMAQELIEKRKVKNQCDTQLEEIVKEVYKKEILTGVMVAGPYKGERVSAAIEKTRKDLTSRNLAFDFFEIGNEVYCRCGSEIIVNIVKNQWFIDYGNEKWKELARSCLEQLNAIPEKTKKDYAATIEWLKEKACARSSGLGTKLPFDQSKSIEALSDSTLYIAFYTFAHLLNGVGENEMTEEFFDYVLLGKENKNLKSKQKIKKLRSNFLYWYPEDSYHSGADLVRNHLPFHIFNHTLLDKKFWPRQFVVNGFVLGEGKKMSKSFGNIIPIRKAILEYSADVIRFTTVSGADLSQDSDFSRSVAEGTVSRLLFIEELINSPIIKHSKSRKPEKIDKWLLSRLHRKIKNAPALYEAFALRELAMEIFYEAINELHWYIKRTEFPELREFFESWILIIAPFMPYHAEEWWEKLGKKQFVSLAPFPIPNEKKIDEDAELAEDTVKEAYSDIEHLINLLGKKPNKIFIYTAEHWKQKLYVIVKKEKKFEAVMKSASAEKLFISRMKDVARIVQALIKKSYYLPNVMDAGKELEILEDATGFFKREFKCDVFVLPEGKAVEGHVKSKNALPRKPAIVIE